MSISLTEPLLQEKADGLSAAIDSALGYLETRPTELNSWIVSRYYGLMQLTIAEQVSSPNNDYNLAKIQSVTEYGHGLRTIQNPDAAFPESFCIYVIKSGYFPHYAKFLGIDISSFAFEKKEKNYCVENGKRYVTLVDLFRRIPELKEVIPEYFDREALSFNVRQEGHTGKFDRVFGENIDKDAPAANAPPTANRHLYVGIGAQTNKVTLEEIRSYKSPFDGIVEAEDEFEQTKYFVGRLFFSYEKVDPWQIFYHSDHSRPSFIIPLFDVIEDSILLNLMLAYSLGIIARYLPDTWHDIQKGGKNHLGSLIEYYMSIFDSVLPLQMYSRIIGERVHILHHESSSAKP
jgi:hypothetical protein